ncbi:MAG: hypothetical protein J2P28_18630 [Actinobacteria bacterium]|nr:hypothetical protein [Actinomycetota bacterium]
MSYTESLGGQSIEVSGHTVTLRPGEVPTVRALMERYRAGVEGEVGAALVVVGLSSERVAHEAAFRDDMIRVAHRSGASLRALAEASGLNRKTVTAIVSNDHA